MILTTMISASIIIAAIFFMSFSFLFFLSSFFSVSQNNVLKGQRMRRRRRTRPPPLALPFPFCFRAPGIVVAAWHYASVAAGGRLLARSCRRSFACVRIDGDVCCNATALSLFCLSRHGASGGTHSTTQRAYASFNSRSSNSHLRLALLFSFYSSSRHVRVRLL